MTGLVAALAGLVVGAGLAWIWIRTRTPRVRPIEPEEPTPEPPEPVLVEGPTPSTLAALTAEGLREPLARLRRLDGCPSEVREPLERLAARLRLLGTTNRPMQAKECSPIELLQEVAEEIDVLRTGAVGTSWSLRTRQPVLLDADRARLAFRELLEACARGAGTGGKVGIRVLPDPDPLHPVRVEVEIGRKFAEMNALTLLVVRHLLETQGARVEVDARVTRICLAGSEGKEPDPAP